MVSARGPWSSPGTGRSADLSWPGRPGRARAALESPAAPRVVGAYPPPRAAATTRRHESARPRTYAATRTIGLRSLRASSASGAEGDGRFRERHGGGVSGGSRGGGGGRAGARGWTRRRDARGGREGGAERRARAFAARGARFAGRSRARRGRRATGANITPVRGIPPRVGRRARGCRTRTAAMIARRRGTIAAGRSATARAFRPDARARRSLGSARRGRIHAVRAFGLKPAGGDGG